MSYKTIALQCNNTTLNLSMSKDKMGRLQRLRRFFSKKDSKAPTPDLTIDSTSINATAICCTAQQAAGPLYWNEARRTYSDPTSTRATPFAELESPQTKDKAGHQEKEDLEELLAAVEADDDDDVFLEPESYEELEGNGSYVLSDSSFLEEDIYQELVQLQRERDWFWPEDSLLSEDVCTAWEDWRVPAEELEMDREAVVCHTERETIYRGYWHGRVHVHAREAGQMEGVLCFLEEVQTMSCIRHRSIQLFMGACISPSSNQPLLLIMNESRGQTLHSHLHTHHRSFTNHSKLRILHQIAEAMDYLHSRDISHGLLTSSHVSLCPHVSLSLAPQQSNCQTYYTSELTYLPPEYIRSLYISQHSSALFKGPRPSTSQSVRRRAPSSVSFERETTSSSQVAFSADVFAFGTLSYELSTLTHPFHNLPLECLLLIVGRGDSQSLTLVTSKYHRRIIGNCWRAHPKDRPTFRQLVKNLEQNLTATPSGLQRSVSVPTLQIS